MGPGERGQEPRGLRRGAPGPSVGIDGRPKSRCAVRWPETEGSRARARRLDAIRRSEEIGGREGATVGRAATDAAAAINRTAAPRPSTRSGLDRVTRLPIIRLLLAS